MRTQVTYVNSTGFRRWDNWAFWGAQFSSNDTYYNISVHIPKKAANPAKPNCTSVTYRIFSKDTNSLPNQHNLTVTDVQFDQEAAGSDTNDNRWFSLGGSYLCDAYNSCAVMLIDEVAQSNEALKHIWADAIKWEVAQNSTNQSPAPGPEPEPDPAPGPETPNPTNTTSYCNHANEELSDVENCNIKCPKEDIVKQECSMPKSSRFRNSTEDKKRRKTWNKSRVVFIPEKASI
ncbi:MAG: hypothetical protein GKR87_13770 [Kiritimatiellae bacterium]|nr:hypothetical protein [Kiritimatiellia bacterium]